MTLSDEKIASIETKLGYTFKDKSLLQQALTHASMRKTVGYDNERLEFLGDPVYNYIITDYIFNTYSDYGQEKLAVIKSTLLSDKALAKLVENLDIKQDIITSKDFTNSERFPISIMGSVYEAIVAAIYLDSGLESARNFVLTSAKSTIESTALSIFEGRFIKDYKSILQDYTQKNFNKLPIYHVVREEGDPHNKIFEVWVEVEDTRYGPGIGYNKKQAEQEAAKKAVEDLKIISYNAS